MNLSRSNIIDVLRSFLPSVKVASIEKITATFYNQNTLQSNSPDVYYIGKLSNAGELRYYHHHNDLASLNYIVYSALAGMGGEAVTHDWVVFNSVIIDFSQKFSFVGYKVILQGFGNPQISAAVDPGTDRTIQYIKVNGLFASFNEGTDYNISPIHNGQSGSYNSPAGGFLDIVLRSSAGIMAASYVITTAAGSYEAPIPGNDVDIHFLDVWVNDKGFTIRLRDDTL